MSEHGCAGWDSCPNPAHRKPGLTEFLLRQIAEDEADADHVMLEVANGVTEPMHAHVLAECGAKRAIVRLHDVVDSAGGCAFCGEPAPCQHLRILALPYADHPDHLPQWRP